MNGHESPELVAVQHDAADGLLWSIVDRAQAESAVIEYVARLARGSLIEVYEADIMGKILGSHRLNDRQYRRLREHLADVAVSVGGELCDGILRFPR